MATEGAEPKANGFIVLYDRGGWVSGPSIDMDKSPDIDELTALRRLRIGFPQFAISREVVRDRGIRFTAFGHAGTHPHTVITDDLLELAEALASAEKDNW
jgi:hypothetical protein